MQAIRDAATPAITTGMLNAVEGSMKMAETVLRQTLARSRI
jgi:hypothetical protein